MNNNKKIALITGATSGIGRAIANIFAKNNINLIICGRREERLTQAQDALSKETDVITLQFDVSDKIGVQNAINSLPENWKKIDILVNNAGNAHGFSPIQEGNLDDWDAMLASNVTGLLYVSRAIMPDMVAKKAGHIINIGSIAGKAAYPNGNVYCATKAAVDMLTQSMRLDLNPYNIKVTAIHPGAAETEFSVVRFKGDVERAKKAYLGYTPLCADDVAEAVLFVVTRPAHVCVSDMVIYPTAQASATITNKTI